MGHRYNNLGPADGVAWGQWMAVAAKVSEEVQPTANQVNEGRSGLRLRRLALHDNALGPVRANGPWYIPS
jgi:hypothetical protein